MAEAEPHVSFEQLQREVLPLYLEERKKRFEPAASPVSRTNPDTSYTTIKPKALRVGAELAQLLRAAHDEDAKLRQEAPQRNARYEQSLLTCLDGIEGDFDYPIILPEDIITLARSLLPQLQELGFEGDFTRAQMVITPDDDLDAIGFELTGVQHPDHPGENLLIGFMRGENEPLTAVSDLSCVGKEQQKRLENGMIPTMLTSLNRGLTRTNIRSMSLSANGVLQLNGGAKQTHPNP